MVDQLNAFASEVTRVAREVGTEGKLGGQAKVPGAGGVWRDLTDNVNSLASNLTGQVRNIADVSTAIANGDLSQKITVEAQGEVLNLKNTINNMVDRLRVFADEVTRVAKEVGTEGKLGGQAEVPGVAGTWKALTDSVNAMANSLTVQVRNIADVATAVTKGDLTRQITVEAQGELDELKQNINQMIGNLRETTERNQEQDWLKTNLAKFSRMMQGQKDVESVSRLIMSELTPLVSAHHGAFFIGEGDPTELALKLISSYAYRARKNVSNRFSLGEGLVGQAALEKQPILLTNVPDDYIQITSGLGEAPPRNVIVLPILFEGDVKAVIELASFLPFSVIHQTFLDQLSESIGVVLNMIQANMRTEELLEQSQKLTQELQSQSKELQQQQEELKRSNTELEAQARTLRQSEELLKEQQEELQQVNEELEDNSTDVTIRDITDFVDRTFRPVAEQKSLSFSVDVSPESPSPIYTDGQRLQQVLKNLLSNAFKFTERGAVTLSIRRADKGRRFASRSLDRADEVIAFGVKDTGIGIARETQQLIFEPFQQADGTTSRKYGGTGLGLSISREIARLLGGEIHVESSPGQGSTFTLFLPAKYQEQDRRRLEDELTSAPRSDRLRSQALERSATRSAAREREASIATSRAAAPPAPRESDRRSAAPVT